jgi:putative methylase
MQMRKRRLEITLQKLRPIPTRSAKLEQYATSAFVAADALWEMYGSGDIAGMRVIDLGCGNGILAIGAKLLGAGETLGIDVDRSAVETARENASALSVDVEFKEADVGEVVGSYDTVIQNPPFGAQTKHADRAFVKKAIELAPRVYSFHNDGTEGFLEELASSLGARTQLVKRFKFEIPYAFEFHRKATETVSVVLLRFER